MNDSAKQDEYFKSNLKNMINIADRQYCPQFTSFLDSRQIAIANKIFRELGYNNFKFFGGYEDCERYMLCVYPSDYFDVNSIEFPITSLKITYSNNSKIKHSDVLGSLMGLNIKRETVGDIIIDNGFSYLFVCKEIESYLLSSLFKIGKANVEICVEEVKNIYVEKQYMEIDGTVASLRLDCIVSFLTNKGRKDASFLITSGKVTVNKEEITAVSKLISPNDEIVIRTYGKYILGNEVKNTRKGRLHINVLKRI